MSTGRRELDDVQPLDEISGKLGSDPEEKRLMRSILDSDEETITDGKLITAAINSGIGAFTPDMLFDKLVTNYKAAKKIYGESFLREISGYSEAHIQRNAHIGEFIQELKNRIKDKIEHLREEGLIDKEGNIMEKALKLSKLILYTEELDRLAVKGILGEKEHKKTYDYGMRDDVKPFNKDRYRNIAVRKTIKLAARRNHRVLDEKDLVVHERKTKGKRSIIYGLDASGSMKGQKLLESKKAGIALAYKAIEEKDKVGLVVFGKEVRSKIAPTSDFKRILNEIASVQAKEKTNIASMINEAIVMFRKDDSTKHLILLTDAMPTAGDTPETETLEAVSIAADKNITVSVIGINLRKEGREVAERIAEIGKGRLFVVRNLEDIDGVVLEDYYKS